MIDENEIPDYSQTIKFPFPPPKDVFDFAEKLEAMTDEDLYRVNGWTIPTPSEPTP